MASEGLIAALDLGSNSFHLLIAEQTKDDFVEVARYGEKVQLAAGLNEAKLLTDDALRRGSQCLGRFAIQMAGIPACNICVVGTDALRRAKNSDVFAKMAEAQLGVPMRIISGEEEAKYIYQGVMSGAEQPNLSSLVFDVGGGSTELILGQGRVSRTHASIPLGCVNYSKQYFPQQRTDYRHFERAVSAILQTLTLLPSEFETGSWRQVIGASGTVLAIETVLKAQGWSEEGITLSGLTKLIERVCTDRPLSELQIECLPKERQDIFLGGVAILFALFKELGLQQIKTSPQALREGLLQTMLEGRQAIAV